MISLKLPSIEVSKTNFYDSDRSADITSDSIFDIKLKCGVDPLKLQDSFLNFSNETFFSNGMMAHCSETLSENGTSFSNGDEAMLLDPVVPLDEPVCKMNPVRIRVLYCTDSLKSQYFDCTVQVAYTRYECSNETKLYSYSYPSHVTKSDRSFCLRKDQEHYVNSTHRGSL